VYIRHLIEVIIIIIINYSKDKNEKRRYKYMYICRIINFALYMHDDNSISSYKCILDQGLPKFKVKNCLRLVAREGLPRLFSNVSAIHSPTSLGVLIPTSLSFC